MTSIPTISISTLAQMEMNEIFLTRTGGCRRARGTSYILFYMDCGRAEALKIYYVSLVGVRITVRIRKVKLADQVLVFLRSFGIC